MPKDASRLRNRKATGASLALLLILLSSGCSFVPWLQDNVKLRSISGTVSFGGNSHLRIIVSNLNDRSGRVVISLKIRSGFLWKEKKKDVYLPLKSDTPVDIEVEGDMEPSSLQGDIEYQIFIYAAKDKIIDKSEKYKISNPFQSLY